MGERASEDVEEKRGGLPFLLTMFGILGTAMSLFFLYQDFQRQKRLEFVQKVVSGSFTEAEDLALTYKKCSAVLEGKSRTDDTVKQICANSISRQADYIQMLGRDAIAEAYSPEFAGAVMTMTGAE